MILAYHGDLLNFLLNARPLEYSPLSFHIATVVILLAGALAIGLLVRAADPGRAWRAGK